VSKASIIERLKRDNSLIEAMHEIGMVIDGREREIASKFWETWGQDPKTRALWGSDNFSAAIERSTVFLCNKYKHAESMEWLTSIDERGRHACHEGIDFLTFAEASYAALDITSAIVIDALAQDDQKQKRLLSALSRVNAFELAMMSDSYTNQRQDEYREERQSIAREYRNEIATSIEASNQKSEILKADGTAARDIAQKTLAKASEIATSAEQSAVAMRDAAQTAMQLVNLIETTRNEVNETEKLSDTAYNHSNKAIEVANDLSVQAKSISKILQLIQNVASQTNMLALNATIEAARAGDAGRGFAVVAQEVKSLAGQAAAAAREIDAKIVNINAAVDQSVESTSEVLSSVGRVREAAGRITKAIAQQSVDVATITSSVDETAMTAESMANTIVAIADETKTLDDQISRVVESHIKTETELLDLEQRSKHFVERMLG
jgi:methyl-accepting chemotaxis protein